MEKKQSRKSNQKNEKNDRNNTASQNKSAKNKAQTAKKTVSGKSVRNEKSSSSSQSKKTNFAQANKKSKSEAVFEKVSKASKNISENVSRKISENQKNKKNSASKKQISTSALYAPLLMLSVMLLLWGSQFYVKRAAAAEENVFLSLCIVQIIAFFAPTLLYYQIKHRRLSTTLLISPLRISHGVFIVFASVLFFTGQILLRYVLFSVFGIETGASSQIQIPDGVPAIQPILAFCVIPAICEEFFFRGIILSEYRNHGLLKAIIISSVFFAFSHFSFSEFIIYLFAGFMLSFLTAVSRSVFPAMILHFANNLINLYAGKFLNELSWLDSEMYFFRFILILIFLFSLWRVLSRMQNIYYQYSEKPPKEAIGGIKPTATGAFRSWTLLLPICAYLVLTAISER